MADDLSIPQFLKISAEDRRKAWEKNPPKPFVLPTVKKVFELPADLLAEQEAERKRKKMIAENRSKNNHDRGTKKIPGSTWDARRGMWVHPTIEKEMEVKTGKALKIKILVDGNPRAKGTGAHARFEAMRRYLAGHPRATLEEVLKNTKYTRTDSDWDAKRKSIQLIKV